MKTIRILALTAMAAALTACSNDDEVNSNYPSDNIVRITANVGNAATRASYNDNNLSEFYICIDNQTAPDYTYHKVKVTKDPTTNSWKTASQMLWQNALKPVNITAVTDNNNTCCHGSEVGEQVENDQSSATDYRSDFLVYQKDRFIPDEHLVGSCIPITFSHLFSQLNINLTFGTEFNEGQATGYLADNPITSIKVGGSILKAICDFTATPVSVTTNANFSAEDVTPHVDGSFTAASANAENAKVSYSCILVPQTIDAGKFNIKFSANGKIYDWTSSADFTLESGMKHTLNLVIGKDVVKLGSFTIKAWEDAGNTTVLATE